MSVNPGWGGQSFIPTSPGKLERLAALAADGCAIEVDGGIDATTAASVVAAGANLLVAGSAVFGDPDPGAAYQRIAAAAGG
jgi:ribulose-phosphate 3-epimerase